ncbi:hypothetical protein JCM16138_15870 [Thermococcus atlanticus]
MLQLRGIGGGKISDFKLLLIADRSQADLQSQSLLDLALKQNADLQSQGLIVLSGRCSTRFEFSV